MTGPNDVILWPCGTWCYREELADFTHKSDDYEVLPANSTRAWVLITSSGTVRGAADDPNEAPIRRSPLADRTTRVLLAGGVTTLGDALRLTDDQLRGLGAGVRMINEIRALAGR